MLKKVMKEVEVPVCDYCNKEIKDNHYAVHVDEFLSKEKHFHNMKSKSCYKKYKKEIGDGK